jgi:hypothetical protein
MLWNIPADRITATYLVVGETKPKKANVVKDPNGRGSVIVAESTDKLITYTIVISLSPKAF